MFAGVDGCKGGWLVAIGDGWPIKGELQLMVCRDFSTVVASTQHCRSIVVDMPIGLPDCTRSSPFPRQCDQEIKQLLVGRKSSVFLAPPRETIWASDPTQFQALHRQHTGCGAGLPVWGIVPKIRDVDTVMTPQLQQRIQEYHPELAWQSANNDQPLESKKTSVGQRQRRQILSSGCASLEALETWKKQVGRAVAIDDLFDAIIGVKVSVQSESTRSVPSSPPRDSRGLVMQCRF